MESERSINKRLVKVFGRDSNNHAMYRIVQNGKSLTEKRKGNFDIFFGNIFVRRLENKVVEVPKYIYIEPGVWILEKLFYSNHPDLALAYTYEPVWTFINYTTGEKQEPTWKHIEYLIKCIDRGPTEVMSELEKNEKEKKEFFEFLGGRPTLDGAIADGSAVSMSGLDGKNIQ